MATEWTDGFSLDGVLGVKLLSTSIAFSFTKNTYRAKIGTEQNFAQVIISADRLETPRC
jgi:hypothetical protein